MRYSRPRYIIPYFSLRPRYGDDTPLLAQWEVKNDIGDTVLIIRDRGLLRPITALIEGLNRIGVATAGKGTVVDAGVPENEIGSTADPGSLPSVNKMAEQ